MTKSWKYHATLDRNGTEDEIIIYTPQGRAMLSVAFWDEPYRHKKDPVRPEAEQKKADAMLIVDALNAYKPRRAKRRRGKRTAITNDRADRANATAGQLGGRP